MGKDLKLKNKLKDNVGEHLHDLWIENNFLNKIHKPLSIKEKNNKFDFIKMNDICSSKDIIKIMKKFTVGENICNIIKKQRLRILHTIRKRQTIFKWARETGTIQNKNKSKWTIS